MVDEPLAKIMRRLAWQCQLCPQPIDCDYVFIRTTYFNFKTHSKTKQQHIESNMMHIANIITFIKKSIRCKSARFQEKNLAGSSLRAGNLGGHIIVKGNILPNPRFSSSISCTLRTIMCFTSQQSRHRLTSKNTNSPFSPTYFNRREALQSCMLKLEHVSCKQIVSTSNQPSPLWSQTLSTTGMALYADGQRLRGRLFVGAVGVEPAEDSPPIWPSA